jgi:hypothetical protein
MLMYTDQMEVVCHTRLVGDPTAGRDDLAAVENVAVAVAVAVAADAGTTSSSRNHALGHSSPALCSISAHPSPNAPYSSLPSFQALLDPPTRCDSLVLQVPLLGGLMTGRRWRHAPLRCSSLGSEGAICRTG